MQRVRKGAHRRGVGQEEQHQKGCQGCKTPQHKGRFPRQEKDPSADKDPRVCAREQVMSPCLRTGVDWTRARGTVLHVSCGVTTCGL